MKYVLVDRYDNVVTAIEFKNDVDIGEIRTYFRKVKNVNLQTFNHLWRVMTGDEYHQISESFLRKPSSTEEFGDWLDVEKS